MCIKKFFHLNSLTMENKYNLTQIMTKRSFGLIVIFSTLFLIYIIKKRDAGKKV